MNNTVEKQIFSHHLTSNLLEIANANLKKIGTQIINFEITSVSLPNTHHQQLDAKLTEKPREFDIKDPTRDSVFISYSHSDWDLYVKLLVNQLREKGVKIWVDQYLLQGGQDWLDKINEALEVCDRMILCVSPRALNSKYVKMEYRHFFNSHKLLVPLICETTKLPAELESIQYVEYGNLALLKLSLDQMKI